ncbi:hypothetical protein H5410_034647 [Solanum commersonii]|uniref:Uncharacterized protein n=1 Tax=Solanum commersonii TaxID=4109 RepID=A0A9J5YTX9_SOLCO|nr:hypothetical protein H5410_034647 [Solanum commersonii]
MANSHSSEPSSNNFFISELFGIWGLTNLNLRQEVLLSTKDGLVPCSEFELGTFEGVPPQFLVMRCTYLLTRALSVSLYFILRPV